MAKLSYLAGSPHNTSLWLKAMRLTVGYRS
ncbi:hypothetical protein MITS9509_01887 [Synechococcus sp. MIT S9509]|nr:hypothetical protein MITS9504_01685 [Synechococcus sp. MIT S9504]KZR91966.1 hypothetical protein MITS9509_01887 [Synechococcus sp. MIT S9509]